MTYVKTGPFSNGGAPAISAAFLNALEAVLSQSSGNSENGKYWLIEPNPSVGCTIGQWHDTLSRGATPVSASIDTSDQGTSGNLNGPSVQHLSAFGFSIQATTKNTTSNAEFCAGNWTVNF